MIRIWASSSPEMRKMIKWEGTNWWETTEKKSTDKRLLTTFWSMRISTKRLTSISMRPMSSRSKLINSNMNKKKRWMEVFVTNGLDHPNKKTLVPSWDHQLYDGLQSDSLKATSLSIISNWSDQKPRGKSQSRPKWFLFSPLFTH